MSENSQNRKERKKRERKQRKEKREREKAQKLAEIMKKREEDEKELYEPKVILEKGYKLDNLGEIGVGANSIIYKIKKVEGLFEKECAAKLIDLENIESQYKKRFLERQLNILKLVSKKHEFIIHIFDIFQTSKRVYIMMELAVNGSVSEFINNNGPVQESLAKKWIYCLGRAVTYLHVNGIAHRNIRTEHLLLDKNLYIKLTGFAFSRVLINLNSEKQELSETNCGVGPYFAPEVIGGEPYNPLPADMWAIGTVLFIVINKRYPFDYKNIFIQMNQQVTSNWKKKFKIQPSTEYLDLLNKLFEIQASKRITARKLLDHIWLSITENDENKRDEKDDIKEEAKHLFVDKIEELQSNLSSSVDLDK